MQCWSHTLLCLYSCWPLIERLGVHPPPPDPLVIKAVSIPLYWVFFSFPIIAALVGSRGILSHRPTFAQLLVTLMFGFAMSQSEEVLLPDVLWSPTSVVDIFMWMCAASYTCGCDSQVCGVWQLAAPQGAWGAESRADPLTHSLRYVGRWLLLLFPSRPLTLTPHHRYVRSKKRAETQLCVLVLNAKFKNSLISQKQFNKPSALLNTDGSLNDGAFECIMFQSFSLNLLFFFIPLKE